MTYSIRRSSLLQGETVDLASLEPLCPMEFAEFLLYLRSPANALLHPQKAARNHGTHTHTHTPT